jgi:RND family efflux transporter MFP subunit
MHMSNGLALGVLRRLAVLMAFSMSVACSGDEEARAGTPTGGGPGNRGGPGAVPRIVPVEVVAAETGRIARSVTVSGNVEPIRIIKVNSQIAGALESVNVVEGTVVRQGAVLAELDDREIAAQLASAEAAHEVAQATFQRSERLRERQVITAAEYERDRAALAAAAAERDQLRTRVGYTTVLAPISGVVLEKSVEAGDAVGSQSALFTIGDLSIMVVRVRVSELDVVEIQQGDAVDVVLDAVPDSALTGRVRRIFPAADPVSRLVPVEVALTGAAARRSRPGFLARTTFSLGVKEDVLLVPASAIVRDATSEAVFVIADDRAQRRVVQTGLMSEGRVEILQGLEPGEAVVITGTRDLRDGSAVRVINAATGAVERAQGDTIP